MVCAVNKIDSNFTGLSITKEECPAKLPINPIWFGIEPTGYESFGGELETVLPETINPTRMDGKGTPVNQSASFGVTVNYTHENAPFLMQGFFFASLRELPTTSSVDGVKTNITQVEASTDTYTVTALTASDWTFGSALVLASGFANDANNGLKTVVSATATSLVVSEALADETLTSPFPGTLQVVGARGSSGDLVLSIEGGKAVLTSTILDFTDIPTLIPGAWIYIGGDTAAETFDSAKGFARIGSVAARKIVFDLTRFSPIADSGTAKTISLFFGNVLKNESVQSLIKQFTYQAERTLGTGPYNDTQAQYVLGGTANEWTLTLDSAAKVTMTAAYVGTDTATRNGDIGKKIKTDDLAASYVPVPVSDLWNTSSDIVTEQVYIHNNATSFPSPLYNFIESSSFSINNNVTPNAAHGYFGAFSTNIGNFAVTASATGYFASVASIEAVRSNADVGYYVIAASKNKGFVFDIPLAQVSSTGPTVERDAAVTEALDFTGARNKNNYVALMEFFSYLPTVAMPTASL